MSNIGAPERATQQRIITLFHKELGYRFLGDLSDFDNNSNIIDDTLTSFLKKSGYHKEQIAKAIYELRTEADNPNRNLFDNNKNVYSLLRYGVQVKAESRQYQLNYL